MVYLTPDIYVIKRMRKFIDEAMDKNTVVKEFELIEKIAKEMREGVSKIDTLESVLIDVIDDLPFGLSKLKSIKNMQKRISLVAFKEWEEFEPARCRILVGQILKRYKDQVKNGTYKYIKRPNLNLTLRQVIFLDEREYLYDLEHYLPDYFDEKSNLEMHERQVTKFLEIYKSDNPCYVVVDLDITIDEIYYTVSDEIIKVNKILAAAYYGEAIDENGKFIGTTIACVEGDILSEGDVEVTTNNNINANL
ncbi:hypothetical protein [Paenibacillus polymyxa]|uniref:hypothetical protein n=1 Tax=Paenibacillus polymyxa TaxID=1406 RepID=UPI002AB48D14|nr:hypothetical protein [Paenibacillus polymyxa]MDY8021221.1 hypothetical protein [Paenibacillus polymyxa]